MKREIFDGRPVVRGFVALAWVIAGIFVGGMVLGVAAIPFGLEDPASSVGGVIGGITAYHVRRKGT